jgi:aryl-alcohol dehydrogenase-like predicted oxidoreductase
MELDEPAKFQIGKQELIRRATESDMATLPQRTVRATDLTVSAQGLGCLNLTGFYGRTFDDDTARATLYRALDLGVTMFDTADNYGSRANEEYVGQMLHEVRTDVVLATKFGIVNDPNLTNRSAVVRGDRAYVHAACDASLRRLRTDYIDLYYCHRADPRLPIEETVGAMSELVKAGKVRYLGLSEVSASTLTRAFSVHPIAALQSEWSLWSRDVESDILPAARKLGMFIVPFSPLGRGFLAGAVKSEADLGTDDYRRNSPRFQGDHLTRNLVLVGSLERMASEKECTLAQLALAWLQSKGEDIVPIPGADRPEYVAENASALGVVLTTDDIERLSLIAPPGVASGARYADMSWVDGETP